MIVLGKNEEDSTTDGYFIGAGNSSKSNGTGNKTNLTITIKGTNSGNMENNITIEKKGAGRLFTVYGNSSSDNPHLILEDITLKGSESNNGALVDVGNTVTTKIGQLTMNSGSRITGNTSTTLGSGVRLAAGGTFTMNDGSIDNNSSTNTSTGRGGVFGIANSTFTMNGGVIEKNISSIAGGGVFTAGTFTMKGGIIRRNRATSNGGGVTANGTFTKTGGIIYGNDGKEDANVVANVEGAHIIVNNNNWRDTTADGDTELDSSKSGTNGGWES
jgi:hypothetical protein